MTSRVSMLLQSRVSPDMLPFSLYNKKSLAIRHMNRPFFPKTLSISSYDIEKYVGIRTYEHPYCERCSKINFKIYVNSIIRKQKCLFVQMVITDVWWYMTWNVVPFHLVVRDWRFSQLRCWIMRLSRCWAVDRYLVVDVSKGGSFIFRVNYSKNSFAKQPCQVTDMISIIQFYDVTFLVKQSTFVT